MKRETTENLVILIVVVGFIALLSTVLIWIS
jgi:hypothetical protein